MHNRRWCVHVRDTGVWRVGTGRIKQVWVYVSTGDGWSAVADGIIHPTGECSDGRTDGASPRHGEQIYHTSPQSTVDRCTCAMRTPPPHPHPLNLVQIIALLPRWACASSHKGTDPLRLTDRSSANESSIETNHTYTANLDAVVSVHG